MKLETFFEKFDQLADAPDAVATMRELILQLAVIGKLCPQDSTEEPASALLAEIVRANKSRYTSGEIRLRENARLSNSAVKSLPNGWSSIALGEIADVNWGNTSLTKKSYSDSGFTAYSATGPDGWIEHAEFACPGIVLSAIGARSGKCFLADGQWTAIKNTITIIPFSPINNDWLFLAINRESAWKKRGGAQPFIALKDAISLPILLPPLAEQKRIVAKVGELMALCDRLEVQQQERETRHAALARASLARFADAPTPASLDFILHKSYDITPADLRKSILTLAVQGKLVPQDPNDEPAEELIARIATTRRAKKAKQYGPVSLEEVPYEAPFSWSWVRLGNISLSSDSGWSPQCLPEARSGEDWGVLKVSAVSWAVFKPEENKALPPGMTSRPDCEVKAGDFLLSRANTEELVARSVVVDQTPPRLMMSDKIVRFTFPDEIERAFINLANTSDPSRAYYARNASGTSSSMKNIGREVMCNLPIPLPPLAEQRRIVAKVDQLMALVNALEMQLAESKGIGSKLLEAVVAELCAA